MNSAAISHIPSSEPVERRMPSSLAEQRIRVLIANDQEWSARSLESVLTPLGYIVERAFNGTQALEQARRGRFDLIFLDAQMPDLHGVEVCRRLCADVRFAQPTPILITTSGPAGRTERLSAYAAGAWEFLPEPLDIPLLLPRIGNLVRGKRVWEAWRDTTLVDVETGLYNERGFERRASEILAEAARQDDGVACTLIVLDPAARQPEHDDSETVLGRVLRDRSRSSDAIGRVTGSAFAVLVRAADAVHDAERLAHAIDGRMREAATSPPHRMAFGFVPRVRAVRLDATLLLQKLLSVGDALGAAEPPPVPAIFSLS